MVSLLSPRHSLNPLVPSKEVPKDPFLPPKSHPREVLGPSGSGSQPGLLITHWVADRPFKYPATFFSCIREARKAAELRRAAAEEAFLCLFCRQARGEGAGEPEIGLFGCGDGLWNDFNSKSRF